MGKAVGASLSFLQRKPPGALAGVADACSFAMGAFF
jgi:hypothetical protein